MNQSKRLIFYLLLNVILSACTILTILWIWDRPGKPIQNFLAGNANGASGTGIPVLNTPGSSSIQPTTLPTKISKYPEGLISITGIIGSGSLADEKVTLVRQGTGELSLSGWKLEDSDGNTFVFPDLILYENGAINVFSGAGMNTVIDLYWNKTRSVWQEGETATLKDPAGKTQATYKIP